MPFTFSHPALVLPLVGKSRPLSSTGLIIGSLTPDFEFFLRMSTHSHYSHTISGLFWFDMPLGIILAFIFHNIVRDSLFDNLPAFMQARLKRFQQFHWNSYFRQNLFRVLISVLIGAFSHVFWDSFTHYNGFFIMVFPALSDHIAVGDRVIPVYNLMQHASTLAGGFIIVYALMKLPKIEIKQTNISARYWISFALLTSAIVALRLFAGFESKFFINIVISGISGVLISLTLLPIILPRNG